MGLTFLLTAGMIVLLFLAIWAATLALPYKGLTKSFPKDVQERLAPRLDNLPMSGMRVLGCVILIFILAAMFGIIIYAGVDGIRQEYSFGRLLLRFLIIMIGVKVFDIVGLDFFLLTKTHFFSIIFRRQKVAQAGRSLGLTVRNR